ncbi:MAG TPA: glycosyltransferase [Gemmatimonadaceae bacterium]|jgi:glycosyltransferase involved in cell wall biosynthesis
MSPQPRVRQRRIAHIMPWPAVGGTEHAQARLARVAEGDEFTNIAFCLPDAERVAALFTQAGIRVVSYETAEPSYRHPGAYLRASWSLARKLRDERVDLVHFADVIAAHRGSLAARIAGIPSVAQVRNAFPEALSFRDRTFLAPVRRFVFVSADAQRVFGYPIKDGRGTVLYDGIDPQPTDPAARAEVREEFGIAPSSRVIGMVARVAAQKDYPTLVHAAVKVVACHPDVRFLIVGQHSGVPAYAEHYATVLELLEENGLAGNFTFTDHRTDVGRIISAMDLCVLSTHQEGLPLVILEAMAQSKPFIATAVGGVPEIVRDGQTGLLVPHGDAPALARAMIRLLDDDALATRLAAGGQELVRGTFSTAQFRERVRGLYRSVLGA